MYIYRTVISLVSIVRSKDRRNSVLERSSNSSLTRFPIVLVFSISSIRSSSNMFGPRGQGTKRVQRSIVLTGSVSRSEATTSKKSLFGGGYRGKSLVKRKKEGKRRKCRRQIKSEHATAKRKHRC